MFQRYLAIPLAALLTLACAPQDQHQGIENSSSQSPDGSVLEIVVYTAEKPEDFSEMRLETEAALSRQDGFNWWVRLRGDGDSFADIVSWDTVEQARAAGQVVQSGDDFAPFIAGISGVRHSGHYAAEAESEQVRDQLQTSPFVEIAIYDVTNVAAFSKGQDKLYAEFEEIDGMLGGFQLESLDSSNTMGDLLSWQDLEIWEATGAALSERQELESFFNGISEMQVFEVFRPER